MTYGQGPYGQAPYGGFSFDPTGPSLVSSTPADAGYSVAINATVSFVLTSPSSLDPYSLFVTLDGLPVIVSSTFLAGYTGTIVFDGFECTVTITSHPDFGYGIPVPLSITITDLAGIEDTFPVTFHTIPGSISVSESLSISESYLEAPDYRPEISETLGVVESIELGSTHVVDLSETLGLAEALASVADHFLETGESLRFAEISGAKAGFFALAAEDFQVVEQEGAKALLIENIDATTLRITFPDELQISNINDVDRFRIIAHDGVPIMPSQVIPGFMVKTLGTLGATGTADADPLFSHELVLDSTFAVGDYVTLLGPAGSWNEGIVVRVEEIVSPTRIRTDKPLFVGDPHNGHLTWSHTSAVQTVDLTVNKATNGARYTIFAGPFFLKTGGPVILQGNFFASVPRPQLVSATFLPEGHVLVTFGEPMRSDGALTNALEYTITGSTTVRVNVVDPVSDTSVLLRTTGFEEGSYTLTVNALGTPKDVAGNPIDPLFNESVFTASVPIASRSIFTDRGPIAKPQLIIASGSGATLDTFTNATLPGAAILPEHVGLYVKLTSATNGGTYRILSRLSSTKVKLLASFTLPDAQSGSIAWQLIDPRNGQIADDPGDVTVTINGSPVIPEAVIGLQGQIVLPTTPVHGDDVQVGYSWVSNPTVDIRRLNSNEFRLNNWDRDIGRPKDASNGHKYRYNNILVRPTDYVPEDIQAVLEQPLWRDLKYRAYERAYTAVLNDPTLLLLNSPTHRIAFPPLQRTIAQTFVSYEPVALPENAADPWIRSGSGAAALVANQLVVGDTLGDVFPVGQPIFWVRTIDLTFPHVFAATWQVVINDTPLLEGVFTGIAAGYSDSERVYVVGFLKDAGIPKIGFLVNGLDPTLISSWSGGMDEQGNPTGAPAVFDWTILHSFRIFCGKDQVLRLFVDGAVIETLKLASVVFPSLKDLHAPFNSLEGVFFGSLSFAASNTSTWDFVRYLILPTKPTQISPAIFVSYEGTTAPEQASNPWTPVGSHGTETILSSDFLLLDSTSATTLSTGLVDGDFRGFVRIEPLLSSASDVDLDFHVQLRTFTHGIEPNSVMAAIDDGDRLVQISFFSDTSAPKFSYGGRTYPELAAPNPWTSMGTASSDMVGQILRISDATTSDGRIYFIDDTGPVGDASRVVDASSNYILESRFCVRSYVPDVDGFAGAMAQVYDGARSIGFMIREVSGTRYVTLHADGVLVDQYAFEWDDGEAHTYRLVKNLGGDLVSLFVDGTFLGAASYSSFAAPPSPQTDGIISFGSSTPASMQSTSVVDWSYTNVWRVLSDYRRYVGVWKGVEGNSLVGYHLPLKIFGRNASIAGNVLTDPLADFLGAGVAAGDQLIIDVGPNKKVYTVLSVPSSTSLTVNEIFVSQPSLVDYRIAMELDWSIGRKYRVLRDPEGSVTIYADSTEILRIGYNAIDLPPSAVGISRIISAGLPSISFGAFDPTNLSQSSWDYVRYGITRSSTEMRVVPHHQALNQRNVMASPEHLNTNLAHTHTDFWSSSTGIPPVTDPDFLKNPGLIAFTLLNEDTPLVPRTQTAEVRGLSSVLEPVSGLNGPEDVLNSEGGFTLNDGTLRHRFVVPDDVLYNSLQVIESSTGSAGLLAPADDALIDLGTIHWQDEVCLQYSGDVLPEQDASSTPWELVSDDDGHVIRTAFAGALTYGTDATGTRTVYRNATPLLVTTLETEVKFRVRIVNDSTGGTGDTQIRLGFSAAGVTMALAFVTSGLGERYVLVYDMAASRVVGGAPFDFLDFEYHVYRVVVNPSKGLLEVFIDA